jgi:phosphate transport system ATP-binding protein
MAKKRTMVKSEIKNLERIKTRNRTEAVITGAEFLPDKNFSSNRKNMNKIEVQNVQCWYGDYHVLRDVNMEVQHNTVTALIGPSGCGKSTYLRIFNRMNDLIEGFKLEGDVRVDGKNIFAKDVRINELRKKVGMVFQKPNPFPKSIFENVAYGLRVNGVTDKKFIAETVESSLKKAAVWNEVKDVLHKNALGLSGGQQQRLCIARAIAVEPSVILMDEPTSALDPISTSKIEELITELKKSFTILIVTHNMQQAARVSDKTAFFYLGDMVEFNDTKMLFNNPAKEQTQNYISGIFG